MSFLFTGCFEMDYGTFQHSEFSFKHYLVEHKDLVGRDWLFRDLEKMLQTSKYGVLFTAEMGVGKSAIMSRLCCINNTDEPGYRIRKNMIAFHMCKFDSFLTQRPEIFITKLVGSLMNHIPEFGNILHSSENRMALNYLQTTRCAEDPFGCFDSAVAHPLKQLDNTINPFVVVIDAVDECILTDTDRPSLISLITMKFPKISKYIKLLASSRNIQKVLEEFSFWENYHLDHLNENNLKDIEEFVHKELNERKFKYLSNQPENFFSSERTLERKILEISNGSFLFATHFLRHLNTTYIVPTSLKHVFELNFDRVFSGNRYAYDKVRPVLEIFVAIFYPLNEEELLQVSEIGKDDKDNVLMLLQNELGFFLRNKNGTISFIHKAVADYLTDENENKKYFISKTNGHKRIAKFMLKTNSSQNIFDLILHISESNDSNLQKIFLDLGKGKMKSQNYSLYGKSDNNILHNAVSHIDSYKAMKLLLKLIGCKAVKIVTYSNVTAAFIASAYGHANSLLALHECKTDLYFKRGQPPLANANLYQTDIVTFCKQRAFWGYTLLHIASQNGHTNVVRFLMKNAPTLVNDTNVMGLYAFNLAAENGHTNIVRELLWNKSKGVDRHSLYHASKNGFKEIVDILLYHGIVDECMTCNGSIY